MQKIADNPLITDRDYISDDESEYVDPLNESMDRDISEIEGSGSGDRSPHSPHSPRSPRTPRKSTQAPEPQQWQARQPMQQDSHSQLSQSLRQSREIRPRELAQSRELTVSREMHTQETQTQETQDNARAQLESQNDALNAQLMQKTQEGDQLKRRVEEGAIEIKTLKEVAQEKELALGELLKELEKKKSAYLYSFCNQLFVCRYYNF